MYQPGEVIGDWVVQKTLGEGGMGAVFLCTNVLSPRISAAVKVMKPSSLDQEGERFIREVEALDQLRHASIVRLKGWGQDRERGILWLAMEFVVGETLEDRIARGPMPIPEAVALFSSLASALAHAHAKGIAHRDIKPANLIISESGDAFLVDFGIATESGRTRLTKNGAVPGTPQYVAPEVYDGEQLIPELMDVYALGQVLYECLTGTEAFPEDEALSPSKRVYRIMGDKIRIDALTLDDSFPAELRALVDHSTRTEPEERLQTMVGFANALHVLPGSSGELPPLPPPTDGPRGPQQKAEGVSEPRDAGAAGTFDLSSVREDDAISPPAMEPPATSGPKAASGGGLQFVVGGVAGLSLSLMLVLGGCLGAGALAIVASQVVSTDGRGIDSGEVDTGLVAALTAEEPPAPASLADLSPTILSPPPFEAAQLRVAPFPKAPSTTVLLLDSQQRNSQNTPIRWLMNNGLEIPTWEVPNPFKQTLGNSPAYVPPALEQERLVRAIRGPTHDVFLFGPNFSGGTRLAVFQGSTPRHHFDFTAWVQPPVVLPDEELFTEELLQWAEVRDTTLFVSNFHGTYARSSKGQNGYLSAVDLETGELLWRSQPLVTNARNFLLYDDVIVTGYGFTGEPRALYVLSQATGEVLHTVTVRGSPGWILRRGENIYVRTDSNEYVFHLGE